MSHRLLPRRTTSLLRAARLSPTTPRLTALLPRQSIPCQQQSRSISQSAVRWALMPHAENPPPKESEPLVEQHSTASEPTPLEEEAYHPLADGYLDRVVARMEEVAEGREDVDVEYSSGVLSITFPPNGTYVLNKQPPNRQIWLSSPISGPKRFDWVVAGEGMHSKEGSGIGDWVYLRDGTTLGDVLRKELSISVNADEHE